MLATFETSLYDEQGKRAGILGWGIFFGVSYGRRKWKVTSRILT